MQDGLDPPLFTDLSHRFMPGHDHPLRENAIGGILRQSYKSNIIVQSSKCFESCGNQCNEETKLSLKWLIFIMISFFGEGFCSVTQKTQQKIFEGKHDSAFMVFALLAVIVVFSVYVFLRERKDFKQNFKAGILPCLYGGIGNGVTNLIVLVVPAVLIPAAVFFPVLSAGQIVVTSLLSVLVYKEKLIPRQVGAILFGVAAIILLNI